MKLTKQVIDKLVYNGKGSHTVFDDELSGFGIRLYDTGKKSFFIDFYFKGRQKRMVIGKYGVMTLDEARKEARKKLVEVECGSDPLEKKRMQRRGDTVKDLAKDYLKNYARPHKKSWDEDERRINQYIIPAFQNRKIESIRRADIVALHQRIGQHARYEANRVHALLSVMFKHAIRSGMVPDNFGNPCTLVQKFKERSRDRWVSHEELPKLWQVLEAEPNPYYAAAIKLLILTGLRKSELLSLQWEQNINLERKEIRLEDTKAGRPHVLPLSDLAMEILQAIPRQVGNPYVIVGQNEGRPLVNIDKPWHRIRDAAGLKNVRIHDLRRTCGSWLANSGKSLITIGRVLNQTSQSVTATYGRLGQDPIRAAVDEHSESVLKIVHNQERNDEKAA